MSTKYKVLLTMVAFSMGLICQYMYMGQSEVKMIVTGTNQGQVFTEKVFYKDKYNHTLYRPRFSTRLCDSNMTYIDFGDTFTSTQIARVNRCISTYEQEYQKGLKEERIKRDVRWSSHTYINNKSFMIEAGGHNGVDVEQFNSRFHPGKYVVLEPVERFFNVLKTKFKGSPNVIVYKFGVDATDGIFYVNDAKDDGSSIFHKHESGKSKAAKIVNVTNFFEMLSVRGRDVDLITLNCEGCEYAVLDLLLSTDYIRHFRNIQFQSHRISGICYPVKRFCWYQELLQKTHKIQFQFKFVWESWSRI
ncbi:uncharacterized protein LOC110460542 isoform X2 [Mizuhopecten yessoensis]|nr:uncharacterized protein LOC110460542 isoform X2 [Mizuhopecten yessoensis]